MVVFATIDHPAVIRLMLTPLGLSGGPEPARARRRSWRRSQTAVDPAVGERCPHPIRHAPEAG